MNFQQLAISLLLAAALVACTGAEDAVALLPGGGVEAMMQRAHDLDARRKLLAPGYRPIPIDSSVVLLFISDVQGGENSPCVQMVKKALEFKGRAINFFVTGYYADWNGDSRVDALGYRESHWDKSFKQFNWDAVNRFSSGLQVSSSCVIISPSCGPTYSSITAIMCTYDIGFIIALTAAPHSLMRLASNMCSGPALRMTHDHCLGRVLHML
jgi:hypothetical protein